MGATNAMRVATHWSDLPSDAFKALIYMALITLDRDPEPTYWGGPEALLEAMGRKPGIGSPAADRRALQRAVQQLVDRGVVAVDKPASRWAQAAYSLRLTATDSVA